MKKILTIILAVLVAARPSVNAASFNDGPDNEFHASYGYFTVMQMAAVVGGVLGTAFSAGLASMDELNSTGSFNLGYMHRVNNWLWLGADVFGERNTLSFSSTSSGEKVSDSEPANLSALNLMFTLKADWLRRERVALYSSLGAGAFYQPDSDTPVNPSLQVNLIGLEAGGQYLRGYLELGLGMHGVIAAGIRRFF